MGSRVIPDIQRHDVQRVGLILRAELIAGARRPWPCVRGILLSESSVMRGALLWVRTGPAVLAWLAGRAWLERVVLHGLLILRGRLILARVPATLIPARRLVLSGPVLRWLVLGLLVVGRLVLALLVLRGLVRRGLVLGRAGLLIGAGLLLGGHRLPVLIISAVLRRRVPS